jgi:glycosyltransferase involved in cell wall biosynthesis
METLAAGVPLICSDCESLTDIGRDSPATIIPRGDPHALAAAIAAEVERPTRERAAEYAPAAAARFEVSHAARELAELYDSLASR